MQGIVGAIKGLAPGVGAEDLVLIYFSGHGTRVPDRGVLDEQDDGMDEALVPFDVVGFAGDNLNVMVDEDFGELLAAIPSRKVLVVVDACHSGSATKGPGSTPKGYRYPGYPQVSLGATRNPKGIVVRRESLTVAESASGGATWITIGAAQDDEEAQATSDGSVFTNALHRAVSKHTGRGVTVEDLFKQIEEQVAVELQFFARARHHHPVLDAAPDLRQLRLPLVAERAGRLVPPTDDPLINKWQTIVRRTKERVEFKVNEQRFVQHPEPDRESKVCAYPESQLAVEVVAPGDGYLNVVNLYQGGSDKVVLFPNQGQSDNRVRRNQTIRIPSDGYCLPAVMAAPDRGHEWNLVVALFSEAERNLYRESKAKEQFATTDLDLGDPKPFAVRAAGFDAAGSQMLLIREQ